jgi:hypothetical protein
VFRFSLQISTDTFPILSRIEVDTFINVPTSSCRLSYFLSDFKKDLNFREGFYKKKKKKCSNIKFHKTSPGGSRVVPCGAAQVEIQGKANSPFSEFCEQT